MCGGPFEGEVKRIQGREGVSRFRDGDTWDLEISDYYRGFPPRSCRARGSLARNKSGCIPRRTLPGPIAPDGQINDTSILPFKHWSIPLAPQQFVGSLSEVHLRLVASKGRTGWWDGRGLGGR
jgi:hypothetical protein